VYELPEVAPFVELLIGIRGADLQLHKTVQVRELNGADEEALARFAINADAARYANELVRRAVVEIEGIDDFKVEELFLGDRDLIVRHVRRLTFGDYIEIPEIVCPVCSDKFGVKFDVTEVPLKSDFPDTMTVVSRRGKPVELRWPTVADQLAVVKAGASTREANNTIMLDRLIVAIDGSPVQNIAKNLGMADRAKLVQFLAENIPGLRYQDVTCACPACEESLPLVFSVFDLFRLY
jgi:hypothetical protein